MPTPRDRAIDVIKRTLLDAFSGAFSASLPAAIVDAVADLLPEDERALLKIERLQERLRILERVERENGESRVRLTERGGLIIDGPYHPQSHGLSSMSPLAIDKPREMGTDEAYRVIAIALAGGVGEDRNADAEMYESGHEAGRAEALLDVGDLWASQQCPHCSETGPRSGWGLILGDDEDTFILVCREAYAEVHG